MKNLTPLEYAGQRVLLSRQVAEVFGVMYAKVKKTFQSHRAKFVAGVHFYLLEGQELKEFRTEHLNQFKRMRMAQMIYLWTASGVALLSKRFEGGEKIYAELAREYFQVEDAEVPQIVTIQGVRGYIDAKGVVWLNAEDVARGLGFVMIRNERVTKSCDNGARYSAVRWNTVNEYLRVFAPFIDDSEVRALIEKGVGLGDYMQSWIKSLRLTRNIRIIEQCHWRSRHNKFYGYWIKIGRDILSPRRITRKIPANISDARSCPSIKRKMDYLFSR